MYSKFKLALYSSTLIKFFNNSRKLFLTEIVTVQGKPSLLLDSSLE